jgi:capsule polysaccharide export protein KpsE/RkpR
MDAGTIVALLGGGSVAGVVADRLVTWAMGRNRERTTLADYETQIAERLLGRMDAQLVGAEGKLQLAEAQMAAANATIAGLREELAVTKGEVGQLRTELAARSDATAERDRLLIENTQLKAHITTLTGGNP